MSDTLQARRRSLENRIAISLGLDNTEITFSWKTEESTTVVGIKIRPNTTLVVLFRKIKFVYFRDPSDKYVLSMNGSRTHTVLYTDSIPVIAKLIYTYLKDELYAKAT